MTLLLLGAVGLLAWANGANDNFKGVASLRNARGFTYRRALLWATAFTFAGSVAAALLARGLLPVFSGAGIVPEATVALPSFAAAVALGAGAAVAAASRIGMPVSTTHALMGALAGAGVAAVGWANVHFAFLLGTVAIPLLLSPVLALLLTKGFAPLVARSWRESRTCVCAVSSASFPAQDGAAALPTVLTELVVDTPQACAVHGAEIPRFDFGDAAHWASAAFISFARGLNDTPKLVALMSVSSVGAFAGVGAAMALGGLLGSMAVARVLAEKIAWIPPEEGLGANLVTASLVALASGWGLPVSTTHVSVGSLFGLSANPGRARTNMVRDILLAWLFTAPAGALFALAAFLVLRSLL